MINNSVVPIIAMIKIWVLIFLLYWIPDDPMKWELSFPMLIGSVCVATLLTAIYVVMVTAIVKAFKKVLIDEFGGNRSRGNA